MNVYCIYFLIVNSRQTPSFDNEWPAKPTFYNLQLTVLVFLVHKARLGWSMYYLKYIFKCSRGQ